MNETANKPNYRVPDARLILKADAPREEWLAKRYEGIGGTAIATIMGANAYQTAYELWADYTHRPEPIESTRAMRIGAFTEELTAQEFTLETGVETRRLGMVASKTQPAFYANIDRLTADGGVLEIKDHELLSRAGRAVAGGEIPRAAYLQLQWYLYVTGRSHGWFAAKVGKEIYVYGPIEPAPDLHAVMDDAAIDFLTRVERGVPPEPNGAMGDAELKARFPESIEGTTIEAAIPEPLLDAREGYKTALAEEAAAKKKKEAAASLIKSVMGDAEALTANGELIATWKSSKPTSKFDAKLFQAEQPEMHEKYQITTPGTRIMRVK